MTPPFDAEGAADGPKRERAEGAFLRFLAQRHGVAPVDFERFLADQPEDLGDELRGLHENYQMLEPLLGGLDGVGLADLSRLDDSLGPTRSFQGVDTGEAAEPFDSEALRAELSEMHDFVSRYEIDRLVAEGGMGCIYRVWDKSLKRFLAMKVIKPLRKPEAVDRAEQIRESGVDAAEPGGDPTDDTRARAAAQTIALARFHAEALVTAQLDHPGIVPVHDIGVDVEGRVYFTMKYVKGRRSLRLIFDLVARGQEGWTLNRAVGTILRVCEAVAYAHSKRVLHRDIKPANIMVGQYGETYLLDWGLARCLDQPEPHTPVLPSFVAGIDPDGLGGDPLTVDSWLFSRDGKIMGTPPYMSPEQARGEVERVDERSDVYSLGALLYHLLTGRTPYVEPDENPYPIVVLVRVQRDPPTPVRTLAPDAPPGLVEICERAMAREPSARYASVEAMAHELEDYLEDISEAREEARRQAQRATRINEFLVRMLTSADPRMAQGREVTVLEVLDQFSKRIEDGLAGMPLDEAGLRRTIGNVYKELGRHEPAREHLERALVLFDETLGFDHHETLAAGTDLAVLLGVLGSREHLDRAEQLLQGVHDVQAEMLGPAHLDTLRTLVVMAENLRIRRERLVEAEPLLQRVIDGRREQLGADHVDTLTAMNRLAMVKWNLDHSAPEAESLLRRAVAGLRATQGERHPETLIAMNDLAGVLHETGRLAEAEDLNRRTLAGQREVLGSDHPETILSLANLGQLISRRGALEEAERVQREAVELQQRVMGGQNAQTLVYRNNLAKTIQRRGRHEEALAIFVDVLAEAERADMGSSWHVARFRFNLGCCLAELGQRDRAVRELRRAYDLMCGSLGEHHGYKREAREALLRLGHDVDAGAVVPQVTDDACGSDGTGDADRLDDTAGSGSSGEANA